MRKRTLQRGVPSTHDDDNNDDNMMKIKIMMIRSMVKKQTLQCGNPSTQDEDDDKGDDDNHPIQVNGEEADSPVWRPLYSASTDLGLMMIMMMMMTMTMVMTTEICSQRCCCSRSMDLIHWSLHTGAS